jgi:hypothetical protein
MTPPSYTKFYFNFMHDILFLSSRFSTIFHTTETYRLKELNNLVPFYHLKSLRRICITYSGMDDYSGVSNAMRWLQGMETLYMAMMDRWSKKTVKRLLARGIPKSGSVSEKIEERLREADDEETEDESEASI